MNLIFSNWYKVIFRMGMNWKDLSKNSRHPISEWRLFFDAIAQSAVPVDLAPCLEMQQMLLCGQPSTGDAQTAHHRQHQQGFRQGKKAPAQIDAVGLENGFY